MKKQIFERIYYGWVIVIIAGIGVFFLGRGQTYSNSMFVEIFDSYTPVLLFSLIFPFIGFLASILANKPVKSDYVKPDF